MKHRKFTKKQVIKIIKGAFPALPIPSTISDTYLIDFEARLLNEFKGKQWMEIANQQFLNVNRPLSYLTMEAQLYYLPAYLVAAIEHGTKSAEWFEEINFLLTPPEWSARARCNELVKALTAEQKWVVRLFYENMANQVSLDWYESFKPEDNRIIDGLVKYWRRWDPPPEDDSTPVHGSE